MSSVETPLWRRPVTYAAIGATQAGDLLRYPPKGFRARERRVRVGHGEARWRHAWTQTLSWGVKERAGFEVERVETPDEVVQNTYQPVTFDEAGEPVTPATLTAEEVYAETGERLVRAGDSAILRFGRGRIAIREPVRVITVVDEPNRRGFSYGTLPGHPLCGEELFLVERREDDTVWFTVRSISRPASPLWWALLPVVRLAQLWLVARYERALATPLPGTTV